jgi:hypothetical protein
MTSVLELYEGQIRALPVADQLHLVRLIVDELAESAPRRILDENDAWSDEDLADGTRFSLRHAERAFGEDDADAEPR